MDELFLPRLLCWWYSECWDNIQIICVLIDRILSQCQRIESTANSARNGSACLRIRQRNPFLSVKNILDARASNVFEDTWAVISPRCELNSIIDMQTANQVFEAGRSARPFLIAGRSCSASIRPRRSAHVQRQRRTSTESERLAMNVSLFIHWSVFITDTQWNRPAKPFDLRCVPIETVAVEAPNSLLFTYALFPNENILFWY
jgi:hypothetical protein